MKPRLSFPPLLIYLVSLIILITPVPGVVVFPQEYPSGGWRTIYLEDEILVVFENEKTTNDISVICGDFNTDENNQTSKLLSFLHSDLGLSCA